MIGAQSGTEAVYHSGAPQRSLSTPDAPAVRHSLPWLVVIVLLAVALRVYRLGHWNLGWDEIFTLRDSLAGGTFAGPKPLLFFLNYHLIRPWTELNELSLRLLPALFGIAAVPVVYWLGRTTLSARAGLFGAVLLAASPWHVYWSQYARYYTLAFVLCAAYPLLLYQGLSTAKPRWVLAGLAVAVLAILAHPSAALLLGGVGAWVATAVAHWVVDRGSAARRRVWLLAVVFGVATIIAAIYLTPILIGWAGRGHTGYHRGLPLLLSYVGSVTTGLVVLAAAGLITMWRGDRRSLAILLGGLAGLPPLLLLLLSGWVPVYTGYLFASTPALYLAAGWFLDRVASHGPDARWRQLVAAACLLVVIAEGGPLLASHYLDGGRPDFRGAAQHIRGEMADGDRVLSQETAVLSLYLPGVPISALVRAPIALEAALRELEAHRPGATLWIVAPAWRRGGFNERDMGEGTAWVWSRCRLSRVLAVPRLDYRHNEIQVHRCATNGQASK